MKRPAAGLAADSVARAYDLFPDLVTLACRKAMHLSGGERRMLELAVVALPDAPTLLLLDEPTAALSSENTERFVAFVRRSLEGGTAVVIATHKHDFREVKHRMVQL